MRDTWRSFAERAATRGLAVALSLRPVTAQADAALLRSILVNLFENAVDYTPAGGELAITVEPDPRGASIRVAISLS